ncbi:DNA methylase [Mycobacterium phage Paphu]|nr:DNA methylase [Mycobacterium phage Paphu]
MRNVDLRLGDCRDILTELEDASVDSIVTDPPYELAFMGKKWDNSGIAFDVEMWEQCLRVLKPGGHLLAFGGSRTWHRLTVAIEDAGFEIRDSIAWLYGSGFPKSLDVAKAIDKAGGESPQRQAEVLRNARTRAGLSRDEVAERIGCTPSSVRDWEEGRSRAVGRSLEWITPSPEYRDRLADLLGYTSDERRIAGASTDRRGDGTVIGLGHSGVKYGTDASTEAAKRWQGWGTALKPAFEPIVVARKPLVGTVAANVLEHGTGAINIDACRVNPGTHVPGGGGFKGGAASRHEGWRRPSHESGEGTEAHTLGRWPTNVVLDEVQAAELGEPQRFFPVFKYQAKAPTKERPKVDGMAHPTVKPLELMRWLVKLVTPSGGVVLDPFAGSGTTVEACLLEGFDCITIENEPEHIPLIEHRISRSTT